MNDIPTPETDEETKWGDLQGFEIVPSDFARRLERERDESNRTLTHIYNWIQQNHPDGFIDSQSYPANLDRCREHAEEYATQELIP